MVVDSTALIKRSYSSPVCNSHWYITATVFLIQKHSFFFSPSRSPPAARPPRPTCVPATSSSPSRASPPQTWCTVRLRTRSRSPAVSSVSLSKGCTPNQKKHAHEQVVDPVKATPAHIMKLNTLACLCRFYCSIFVSGSCSFSCKLSLEAIVVLSRGAPVAFTVWIHSVRVVILAKFHIYCMNAVWQEKANVVPEV